MTQGPWSEALSDPMPATSHASLTVECRPSQLGGLGPGALHGVSESANSLAEDDVDAAVVEDVLPAAFWEGALQGLHAAWQRRVGDGRAGISLGQAWLAYAAAAEEGDGMPVGERASAALQETDDAAGFKGRQPSALDTAWAPAGGVLVLPFWPRRPGTGSILLSDLRLAQGPRAALGLPCPGPETSLLQLCTYRGAGGCTGGRRLRAVGDV